MCGECHSNDEENLIEADEDGWIQSQQQQDEFMHSPHYTGSPHFDYLGCATCHDPHAGTSYGQGGIKDNPSCDTCHPDHQISGKESLECLDCHMPLSVKSAISTDEYSADMRSHLFKIWVTTFPKDSMFYTDETGTYVKLDENGQAYGNTLDLVCLSCHESWTIQHVYEIARNIHTEGLYTVEPAANPKPAQFGLCQNYPNPFNPLTMIEFSVVNEGKVNLEVFNIAGRKMITLLSENLLPGLHSIEFSGENLPAGLYFYKLSSGSDSKTGKMLLLK